MDFLFLEIKDDNVHGTVVLSGSTMMLDSTVGGQFFDIPTNLLRTREGGEALEAHIALQFPTRGALEMSARLFKEGFTNKERFKESISRLLDKKKITKDEHTRLLNLINSCDCGPVLIRQKVHALGLGRVLSEKDFGFEDPHHDFTRPIDFLWGWIEKHLPKEAVPALKKETPVESKSSAKRVAALKSPPKEPSPETESAVNYLKQSDSRLEYAEEGLEDFSEVEEITINVQSKKAVDFINVDIVVPKKEDFPEESTKVRGEKAEVMEKPKKGRKKKS